MGILSLKEKFARIGAELVVDDVSGLRSNRWTTDLTIDVRSGGRAGEQFVITQRRNAIERLEVVDLRPELRHLMLLEREGDKKSKFLCGHDERHWFVCSMGDKSNARGVVDAMEALKPTIVKAAQLAASVKTKDRHRRRNAGFLRQGEWFFVPTDELDNVDTLGILHHEPVMRASRGGSRPKPHIVEEVVRTGGQLVRVCWRYPRGVIERVYADIVSRNPSAAGWGWQTLRRNPDIFGRGAVRHPDHATIHLDGWHRIVLNLEVPAGNDKRVVYFD